MMVGHIENEAQFASAKSSGLNYGYLERSEYWTCSELWGNAEFLVYPVASISIMHS